MEEIPDEIPLYEILERSFSIYLIQKEARLHCFSDFQKGC